MIAAPHSGSGKTTLSIGLMAGLARQRTVQAFKCGPDYIDPMYHAIATNRPSRNLDTWLLSHTDVKALWHRAIADADIAIGEGVMGLYDGYDALTEHGSTAEIAKLLKMPVILVIDVRAMARSAGAIALGCQQFDTDVVIGGVICNNVASDKHARWVREAIESVNIPVLGCLPKTPEIALPERHLGLHTAHEHANSVDLVQQIADVVAAHVDLDQLMTIAQSAPQLDTPSIVQKPLTIQSHTRIAVAHDEAFSFYYQDNLDLLEQAGAEIVFFSPLRDQQLPDNVSGLYLGGGYPELYAETLAQNTNLLDDLRKHITQGLPTYAECGGLMMLTDAFIDDNGIAHPLAGIISGTTTMHQRLSMGYREITAQCDTLLLHQGETIRGHEFHYSRWDYDRDEVPSAYTISPRYTDKTVADGYAKDNVLASYVHLHFASNPKIAKRFVQACTSWQTQQKEAEV